jgi:shikimate kinase
VTDVAQETAPFLIASRWAIQQYARVESFTMQGTSAPTSLVYLLGSPGVGKRTVAEALSARTGAIVLDNHRINLPIMSLFDWDGSERLPPEVWGYVDVIRSAVLDALAEIAPRQRSYVLTNALEVGYEAWFDRIEGIARARGSVFVPVLLECELEEQLRRVASEDRVVRLKLSDPERAREFIAGTEFFRPAGPGALVVDTTHRAPDDTAALIAEHVDRVTAKG